MPPLSVAEIEALITVARNNAEEILIRARQELEEEFRVLRDAVLTGNPIDSMVKTSRAHRLATSQGLNPDDLHSPRLKACGLSVKDLCAKVKWSDALYSNPRHGTRQIQLDRALKIQKATISDEFPKGIEPTKEFWPMGVVSIARVVK